MADTPVPKLRFEPGCPDCGKRRAELPGPFPEIGDDFDWRVRDYDGFRLFMLEELAARFPERTRWTPADMEVVIVEILSAVLDQLSDMTDRAATEAFLETARRPESVRRLLAMIGYSAIDEARARGEIDVAVDTVTAERNEALERFWRSSPHSMELARREGPRAIRTQHRMVTADDYARRLEDHPLLLRAHAWNAWTGSWHTMHVAAIGWGNHKLEDTLTQSEIDALRSEVDAFNLRRRLDQPEWDAAPTLRTILRPYLDAYRMAGQEVILQDAVPVPVSMAISIIIADNYFRSEVTYAVATALGTGPSGFFEPGRLRFGEDLYPSDLIAVLMVLEGVENVCLNRFKRIGDQYPDRSGTGRIELSGLELAVCDNDPTRPERGYYDLTVHGGRTG